VPTAVCDTALTGSGTNPSALARLTLCLQVHSQPKEYVSGASNSNGGAAAYMLLTCLTTPCVGAPQRQTIP